MVIIEPTQQNEYANLYEMKMKTEIVIRLSSQGCLGSLISLNIFLD